MSAKHFSSLSILAVAAAALLGAGCGGNKKADTTTPAAAQAPATSTPATSTPAPAPSSTTTATKAVAPAGAQDPVALAAATSDRQAGALGFAMKGTVTTDGKAVPLAASGAMDRRSQRGAFTTKTMIGTTSFTVQQVLDKQVLYLKSAVFAGRLPGGKSWMKIDLAKAAKLKGVDVSSLGASGPAQDPVQGLDYLKGAGAAKKLGTAKVDGVATTRYRVRVDLKRAVKGDVTATAKRSLDSLIDTLGGPTRFPVDVWVDGDHLIRRQRVGYTATVGGKVSTFDITTDYKDYGAKLTGKPPAAGDAIDGLAALQKAAAAEAESQQAQG